VVAKKPPQKRSTDVAITVRMTSVQKARMDEALAKLIEDRPGVRPVLSRFLIEAGLEVAERILAEK
jgi:hypothetical protein